TLYSRGGDSNSSLARTAVSPHLVQHTIQVEVETDTVDEYLLRHGLPVPDLVKIDTEGAEINILQGASSLLSSPATILCELHPYAWEGFGRRAEDLLNLVERHGRRIRYLDMERVTSKPGAYGCVLLER